LAVHTTPTTMILYET